MKKSFSGEELCALRAAMEVLHALGKDGEHPLRPWEWCNMADYGAILKNVYKRAESHIAEEANAVLAGAAEKVRSHVSALVAERKEAFEKYNTLPEDVRKFVTFPREVIVPLQELARYFPNGTNTDDVRHHVIKMGYTVPHKSKKIVVTF
jgi:hypothetical protein